MTKNFTSNFHTGELVETIGRALNGKRNGKGGFDLCDCPAHGGRECLSVDQGADGVLLKCHTGCDFEQVRDALRGMGLWPEHGEGEGKTTAERAAENIARRRALDAEQAARHQDAAAKAKALYEAANIGADATAHPYNQERGGRWTGHTARRGNWPFHGGDGDALLLPYTDAAGELRTLQAISGTGRPFSHGDKKDYYPGGAKRGNFYTFFELGEHVRRFFIGEGFFTVQAAQEAFYQTNGEPPATAPDGWITAGDAGNLEPVARAIHAAHPGAAIIILADEDGPGIIAANKAALAAGGKVARPSAGLPTGANIAKGYDFDNLLNEAGAGAVCAALDKAAKPEGGTVKDAGEAAYQEQAQREEARGEYYHGPADETPDDFLTLAAVEKVDAFRRRTEELSEMPIINTGLAPVDRYLEGLRGGQVYTVAAVPGLGKTSLFSQIGDSLTEAGQDVVFFTIEVTERQLMAKSLSRRMWTLADGNQDLALSAGEIDKGKFLKWGNADLLAIYDKACREYKAAAKGRIWLVQGNGREQTGTEEMRAYLDRYKRHFPDKTPVVFLDYLQLLRRPNTLASDKQNTDDNILALKDISERYQLPLFLISSLNRSGYQNPDDLANMKESGLIEYTSDVIIILKYINKHGHNCGPKEAHTEIDGVSVCRVGVNVIKNRHGKKGELPGGLLFYPRFGLYTANDGALARIDNTEELGRGVEELAKAMRDEEVGIEGIAKRTLISGKKKGKFHTIYSRVGQAYRGEEKGAPRFNNEKMEAIIEEAKQRGVIVEVERASATDPATPYIILANVANAAAQEGQPRQPGQGELFDDEAA